ncbi:MAG: hypothetical protein M0D53_09530 [Flavobacterium sp. JAD_PAG50586_2]|nr:MAG: hypothetical protein M0D53_09530 [Flavobacterium sp. JAD_PAG50586_2]
MKAIIFILGILFITHSNAQKFDCTSKTAAYQELLKAAKTAESYDIWNEVKRIVLTEMKRFTPMAFKFCNTRLTMRQLRKIKRN